MSLVRSKNATEKTALRNLFPLLLPPDRTQITESQTEILKKSDWVNLANELGLGPTFYVYLHQGGYWSFLPARAQEILENSYRRNIASCIARENILGEIIRTLKPLGQMPILLKGLAFANQLYPEIAARDSGDIDLMIPVDLKKEVHQRLEHAGFKLLLDGPKPRGKLKLISRRLRGIGQKTSQPAQSLHSDDIGETTYLKEVAEDVIMTEIHYHLINMRTGSGREKVFRTRDEGLPNTLPMQLTIGEVNVLEPSNAFLHALRHLALHHRLIGFRWHHDLALMLAHWESLLDPEIIHKQCEELNSEKILCVELALLRELFGSDILSDDGWQRWQFGKLPWEYPLYQYVAKGGERTPWRELVRTFIAPNFDQQLQTLN